MKRINVREEVEFMKELKAAKESKMTPAKLFKQEREIAVQARAVNYQGAVVAYGRVLPHRPKS